MATFISGVVLGVIIGVVGLVIIGFKYSNKL